MVSLVKCQYTCMISHTELHCHNNLLYFENKQMLLYHCNVLTLYKCICLYKHSYIYNYAFAKNNDENAIGKMPHSKITVITFVILYRK